jgi:hypothetical protein
MSADPPDDLTPPRALLRKVRDGLRKSGAKTQVDVRLSRPCDVPWEAMTAVAEGVRRCDRCRANVYDFVGLSRREIIARIRANGGTTCAQVAARSDGRLVFGECAAGPLDERIRGGLTLGWPD